TNLRDWNISRQIWWGHRIPVYTCASCGAVAVQIEAPVSCGACGGEVEQDPDTLDTWFSSALWPFAVLGWPDADEFSAACEQGAYPTALMITGRDILYLWIVRMVMTSLEFTEKIPFRQVLVHPTVLNVEGRRMSKSLGTGVDPLDLIGKYGSDATRFSLLYQCTSDQDIRFGEERTEMARNFCNKIWNASRFVLMNLGEDFSPAEDVAGRIAKEGALAERWILSRCSAMLKTAGEALAACELGDAARAMYEFFWSEFCDWFVEMCKPALRAGGEEAEAARQSLWFVLERTLRALHPFMPFISEEIWQKLPAAGEALIAARWPEPNAGWRDEEAERQMEALMEVVVAARKLRAEQNVPQGQRVSITAACEAEQARSVLASNEEAVLLLARGSDLTIGEDTSARPTVAEVTHCYGAPAMVSISIAESQTDLEERRRRLARRLAALEQEEARQGAKLANGEFLRRAPAAVVEKARARYAEIHEERTGVEAQLADLAQSLAD
ncbi:MAG: class I tRNA ligase family protein, partial [Armatimonadetes bacterium]|nr:class I tRNA ligase family protein [Armatimonadota bacterium]